MVTGTHLSKKHGYTINEIKKDGFRINATLKITPNCLDNLHLTKAIGKGVIQFAEIFSKFKPDINFIMGDRDEMLSSAIAASHMNILNAHLAGGDVLEDLMNIIDMQLQNFLISILLILNKVKID